MSEKIISFPHLGDYYVPINFLLTHTTNYKIMIPLPITKKTIELGSKYSPDTVCVPFKYNLGNFIESLENGANVIIQAGGGCRYGYYSEIQEKILKDLGYNFEFYSLVDVDRFKPSYMYKIFKKLNPKINIFKFGYYSLLALTMLIYMDKIDEIIRHNIGFEVKKNSFKDLKKEMLDKFSKTKGFINLTKTYFKYKKKFKSLEINKPKDTLKIGIIGELYTAMEPFSTYFLEEELAKNNIEIKRFTNATYLLFIKAHMKKKYLKKISKYCKYTLGADGMDNVYRAKWLSENGYDGIIHTKPSFCTPEVGAIPIIDKLCKEEDIPIIYFSFDQETSEVGIKTRLEAFYDMLKERKEKEWNTF